MANSKNPDFLSIKAREPELMKEYLHLFLNKWRNFYPDLLKTHVENIVYSKKISKLEAIKELENEIIEEFNYFLKIYQSFSNPFKIYRFQAIKGVKEFIVSLGKKHKLEISKNNQIWVWCKDSSYLFDYDGNNNNKIYTITSMVFKENVNWPLTLLRNCELNRGLEEKVVVILLNKKIKILGIDLYNF